ncbi:MAG: glycoside hydrolase family 3 protein [Actinobacteria bacterium]|nr:glycoside hydrolase family 3 protein [Actinomycetota bacterium]
MTTDDRRLAAGLLLGSFRGTDAPGWFLDLIAEGLGGVVLFADNVGDDDQLRALCARLTDARSDVVIAMDEEAGDVTRLDAQAGSRLPGPAVLGVIDEDTTTRKIATLLGRRLADIGVTMNLAPCADVNLRPDNPIVGVRAFSADIAVAERQAPAFVEGMQRAGVAACVKHFPGHGGTSIDSHAAAPVLGESFDEMLAGPLRPFVAAIRAGSHSLMTGHLLVPAVDDLPASISRRWTEILRDRLHFDGVIVTDALDMGAVEPIAATIDAIVAALQDRQLDRRQLETSVQRITNMQRTLATARAESAKVDCGAIAAYGRSVAARALRIEGNVRSSTTGHVIECRPEPNIAVGVTAWGLVDVLGETGWSGEYLHPGQMPVLDRHDASAGPLVVVVRDAARDHWQRDVIERCVAKRRDLIVVEMGWPGPINDSIAGRICTFGASRASGEAAMQRLTNEPDQQEPEREVALHG